MAPRWLYTVAIVTLFVSGAGCASSGFDHPTSPVPRAPLSVRDWGSRHTAAARDLAAWVKSHDDDATQVLRWTSRNQEEARDLVDWAAGHASANADGFLKSHPGWKQFRVLVDYHESAVDGFLAWCHNHAEAARDFLTDPDAVSWTGDHPVAAYWSFERPSG